MHWSSRLNVANPKSIVILAANSFSLIGQGQSRQKNDNRIKNMENTVYDLKLSKDSK